MSPFSDGSVVPPAVAARPRLPQFRSPVTLPVENAWEEETAQRPIVVALVSPATPALCEQETIPLPAARVTVPLAPRATHEERAELPPVAFRPRGDLLFGLFYGLIVLAFLLTTALAGCDANTRATQQHGPSTPIVTPGRGTPSSTTTGTSPTPGITASAAGTILSSGARPGFERGIVTPEWGPTDYSTGSPWQSQLTQIAGDTHATWVEMPVFLSFVHTGAQTLRLAHGQPSPASVAQGIAAAHRAGLHVFLVPLTAISDNTADPWVGRLLFPDAASTDAWFATYWAAWHPYVAVAAQTGVEQMAIATEWSQLAFHAGNGPWLSLLEEASSLYHGRLTYDMNWGEAAGRIPVASAMPGWMSDGRLAALGVSSYFPLLSAPQRLSEAQIAALWQTRVRAILDHLALATGKPLLISELGYRATADALFNPWQGNSTSGFPVDGSEQAAALAAAIATALGDPHVTGTFVWGWQNAGGFNVADQGITREALAAHYQQE